jgi:hypothetical protein
MVPIEVIVIDGELTTDVIHDVWGSRPACSRAGKLMLVLLFLDVTIDHLLDIWPPESVLT